MLHSKSDGKVSQTACYRVGRTRQAEEMGKFLGLADQCYFNLICDLQAKEKLCLKGDGLSS